MRTAVAVMARCPEVGTGKTRLARGIGADAAYRLYRAFLADIDARLASAQRALIWMFYPPDGDFPGASGLTTRCLPQEGADLGARMWNCFRTLCQEGFERVIVIGADVPHVRNEWLNEAEMCLENVDLVLGPSDDGGYYLAAMCTPHDIFCGIRMGTERVRQETLCRADALGLRVHLLPCSFDIDEESDLLRLRALLHADVRLNLPRTAAVLADVYGDIGAA